MHVRVAMRSPFFSSWLTLPTKKAILHDLKIWRPKTWKYSQCFLTEISFHSWRLVLFKLSHSTTKKRNNDPLQAKKTHKKSKGIKYLLCKCVLGTLRLSFRRKQIWSFRCDDFSPRIQSSFFVIPIMPSAIKWPCAFSRMAPPYFEGCASFNFVFVGFTANGVETW